jgi:hypothetical protein
LTGKNKTGLNKYVSLLLAVHLLLVFCAVDLFHLDNCHADDGGAHFPKTGCPACLFKIGAYAEQPEMVVACELILPLHFYVPPLIQSQHNREPACRLFLRGPPVADLTLS